MPTQSLNGTSFYYAERGAGVPLVLLHGFPHDCRVWNAQLAGLAGRCRVVAPDLRGFGRTASADPFTMESLADDVHDLLRSIDALPCVLAGLSMGGYVALASALKYPQDLSGLVLVDTKAAGDSAEARAGRQQMIELARTRGAAAVAETMLPKMVATGADLNSAVARDLRRVMETCPPLTMEHALAAMRDRPDQTPRLGSIATPTLIIVGAGDVITPPDVARAMAAALPHATVRVIPGAGHMAAMEQPGAVNEAMGAFLDRSG